MNRGSPAARLRQRDLEILLERVPPHPAPKAELEQYATSATIAADLLFKAHALGDLAGMRVVDLGAGTGILAIGAKLLGATEVIGYDVDETAVEAAREAARALHMDVRLEAREIRDVDTPADTVLTNPPFGAQRKHADRPFLEKALELADVSYLFHNAGTSEFVQGFVESRGGRVTHHWDYEFPLRHQFTFQEKAMRRVPVRAARVERAPNEP